MLRKNELFLLILLFLALACKNDTKIEPRETLQKTKVSSLEKEPYLKELLDKVGFVASKNGRIQGNMSIDTDSIIMALQKDNHSYSYTFAVENKTTATSFTNLVFKRVVGGVKAFYLKYESESLFPFDMRTFTGKVTSYGMDGKAINSQSFQNGKTLQIQNPGGRTLGCMPATTIDKGCSEDPGISSATGLQLPCLHPIIIITLDYSGCFINSEVGVGGGNLPTQYTRWSDGTFVPSQYFNDGGPGGGPAGGGGSSCGGNGVNTPSSGTDPNGCSDNIGVYVPTEEELNRILLDKWEDDQILDSQLKPCMQNIMADLKNLTNGSIARIIQKFSGTIPGYNWEVKDGVLPSGQNAFTSQLYNKTTGTVTTTFDSNKLANASDLSVARTILHESIHAYLVTYFRVDPANASKSYPDLVKDYATQMYGGSSNDIQHAEFVRNFVNDIAIALSELGGNRGYNQHFQFYQDLAWGGLTHMFNSSGGVTETPWFLSAFPNQSDRNRVINVINVELTKQDTNGNTQTQKGNNAGC